MANRVIELEDKLGGLVEELRVKDSEIDALKNQL